MKAIHLDCFFHGSGRVGVAGWPDESYVKLEYQTVAVEAMKSSKLKAEIMGLKKIHVLSAVYAVDVDAFGPMNGQINGIPIVSLDAFRNGIVRRIEMAKNAIKERKNSTKFLMLEGNLTRVHQIGNKRNISA